MIAKMITASSSPPTEDAIIATSNPESMPPSAGPIGGGGDGTGGCDGVGDGDGGVGGG